MDERCAISRYEQAVLLLPPKWQRLARQLPDHQKVLAEELRLSGEVDNVMRRQLMVATEEMADDLAQRFRKNPEQVYSQLVTALYGE